MFVLIYVVESLHKCGNHMDNESEGKSRVKKKADHWGKVFMTGHIFYFSNFIIAELI